MINKKGFTLVELLAVIVILAIILVIAVPKVMSVIEDAKKATLESTAKMIASAAEKVKVQNKVLGKTNAITCENVAKINNLDYDSCSIEFVDNTAKVTIKGKGKFEGLNICAGTKTGAEASDEECSSPLEVKHPMFLSGQILTPDKFEVTLNENGNTRKLNPGNLEIDEEKIETITAPEFEEDPEYGVDYLITEEYEYTFEGAEQIQIIFKEGSDLRSSYICEDDECQNGYDAYSYIDIYDKKGNKIHHLSSEEYEYIYFDENKEFIIQRDYIKVVFSGYYSEFTAEIKPLYRVNGEYTVSPVVVPNTDGNFDVTIDANAISSIVSVNAKTSVKADEYIESLKEFDVVQTNATHNGETLDAGIRYVGDNPNNKVYFNCDDKDSAGVSYGANNYNYESSCEVWRIIGLFDVAKTANGPTEKRLKIISDVLSGYSSTSWDYETNEWSQSEIKNLLNGEFLDREYYKDEEWYDGPNSSALSISSLNLIDDAVWSTRGFTNYDSEKEEVIDLTRDEVYFLEKRSNLTGCNIINEECNSDSIERKLEWVGKIGLIYPSDFGFASENPQCTYLTGHTSFEYGQFGLLYSLCNENNWLGQEKEGFSADIWTISPYADGGDRAWSIGYCVVSSPINPEDGASVRPTTYLKSGIKIIGGNGFTEPYKLAI